MKFDQEIIKKILLDGNYVTAEDIKRAEEYMESHRGSFLDYLVGERLINDDIVGQAIAESFGVSYSNLTSHEPTKTQVLIKQK